MNDETGALIMSSQPKPKDATQMQNEAHVRTRTLSEAARGSAAEIRALRAEMNKEPRLSAQGQTLAETTGMIRRRAQRAASNKAILAWTAARRGRFTRRVRRRTRSAR